MVHMSEAVDLAGAERLFMAGGALGVSDTLARLFGVYAKKR